MEHEPGGAPEADRVLEGLKPYRVVDVEDGDTVAFASRYEGRFAAMRTSGAWDLPHPWVEAMIPADAAQVDLFPQILELYPLALGDGPRILFVNRRRAPPFFMLPDDREIACCTLLPVGVPAHALAATLEAFRTIHARIVAARGKRVLSGWTTMMNGAALREAPSREQAAAWAAAQRAVDPRGVLDSPLVNEDPPGRAP